MTILPDPKLHMLMIFKEYSQTVSFIIFPIPLMNSPVRKLVDPITVLQLIDEIANIFPVVCPAKHTNTIDRIVRPFALILPSIRPLMASEAINSIVGQFSLILFPVVPLDPSGSMLLDTDLAFVIIIIVY